MLKHYQYNKKVAKAACTRNLLLLGAWCVAVWITENESILISASSSLLTLFRVKPVTLRILKFMSVSLTSTNRIYLHFLWIVTQAKLVILWMSWSRPQLVKPSSWASWLMSAQNLFYLFLAFCLYLVWTLLII